MKSRSVNCSTYREGSCVALNRSRTLITEDVSAHACISAAVEKDRAVDILDAAQLTAHLTKRPGRPGEIQHKGAVIVRPTHRVDGFNNLSYCQSGQDQDTENELLHFELSPFGIRVAGLVADASVFRGLTPTLQS